MANQWIGNYRVVRLLGEGGMGLVYEAVREDIAVRAAIKVLRPEYARNADIAGRFFNEARAVNIVQHPGVVRVFDYGQLPTGEAYLAMEYLEGDSLRQRMSRELRLNEAETMRIARQIAAAVAAAHAKQIIHRDLKPENVMIIPDAETPGGERAKVLDFGIAKLDPSAQSSVRTRTNTMMGTPIYMAPEQCRGLKTITDRADVYALGVMMFEMLASRPPFTGEAPGDVIAMHIFQPPPSLRESVPDVDFTLHRLIDAMLSKDPQARPSMAEVAQKLKALGNLQSDVMPMRLVRELSGDLRPGFAGQGSPAGGRNIPSPKPEAAPPGPAHAHAAMNRTDPEATMQMREAVNPHPPNPMQLDAYALRNARAAAERLSPMGQAPQKAKESPNGGEDLTAAIQVDDSKIQKSQRAMQKQRIGLLVFAGLLVVAFLLAALVLLVGSHGDVGH